MIILDGNNLNLLSLKKIARDYEQVKIAESTHENINRSRAFVALLVEKKEPVYGINTGFGRLATESIDYEDLHKLQENLLKSHACGVGGQLSIEEVRAMLALRINALIKGYSGIRLEVIEKMVEQIGRAHV